MQRVAVVGAGLAGLTCARSLVASGCDVVVFEKSRGVGGRLSTRRAEIAQYDHGAQYFTVRDERFHAFVQARLEDGSVAIWRPRLEASLAQVIDEPWYVGTPGMSALGRAQASGLDVRTQVRVQSLAQDSGQWRLFMEGGEVFDGYDAVVVAVPNAQAVPLIDTHAPEWSAQLEQTPMQPCWTLMFSTAAELTDLDAGLPRGGAIGWWARNSSKPGRTSQTSQHDWVVQANAQWTVEHLETAKPDVERELLQAFERELGGKVEPLEPPMAHRWLYSRRASGVPPLTEPLWHLELGIGLCGDGLAHSRVEQAYLSGLHLAEAITKGAG